MKVIILVAHVVVALSLVSDSAYADQMIISYSSGKTQTITLDEPIEQVKDMRLDRNADSISEKVKRLLTGKPGSEEQGTEKEQPATKQNPLPRIEWAPPLSE